MCGRFGRVDLRDIAFQKRLDTILFSSDGECHKHREAADMDDLADFARPSPHPVSQLQFHVDLNTAPNPAAPHDNQRRGLVNR